MEPNVKDLTYDEQYLRFTLENVNVSIANAIRRIILSEIPCVVFRTTPYKDSLATIDINTSRMNNELIKQRISCIPIHIKDISEFDINDYVVEVDERNDSEEIIYVTSKHLKIRHLSTGKYISETNRDAIFPRNEITGDFIDIVRLRPKISDKISGEHIKMSMKLALGTAKRDGAFNVVSTCSYAATPDTQEIEINWKKLEQEMQSNGKSESVIKYVEKDWRLLQAKRITKPDSFDFVIESVGQFEPIEIVKKAIGVMRQKLMSFKDVIHNEGVVSRSNATTPNMFDIILKGEDYTLGKVLEFILYRDYYETKNTEVLNLNYCGFKKPHPHIDLSVIRIGFNDESVEPDEVINLLEVVYYTATNIFDVIEKKL